MPRQPSTSPRHAVALVVTGLAALALAACSADPSALAARPEPTTTSAATTSAPSTTSPPITTTGPTTTRPKPSTTTRKPAAKTSTARKVTATPTPRSTPRPKPSPKPKAAPKPPSSADAAMAAEVLRLVNRERAKAGCGAVHRDSRIERAALLHSQDMARNDYFSHTSRDGRSPWDRMRAQGYTYGSGENIAAGQGSAAAVMRAWMNSSGHRANILNCKSKAMGVGIGHGGSYGIYWTQGFGTV